jgi:hypothetical protein
VPAQPDWLCGSVPPLASKYGRLGPLPAGAGEGEVADLDQEVQQFAHQSLWDPMLVRQQLPPAHNRRTPFVGVSDR